MFEAELWDLYTFFLNAFNVFNGYMGQCGDSFATTQCDQNMQTASQDNSDGGATEKSAKPQDSESFGDNGTKWEADSHKQTMPEEEQENVQCADDTSTSLVDDQKLKSSMLAILEECIRHQDVHRYILLQEVRALLRYLSPCDVDWEDHMEESQSEPRQGTGNFLDR